MTSFVPVIVPVAKIILAVFCLGWAFALCRHSRLTITDAEGDETVSTSWPLVIGAAIFGILGAFIVATLPR